MAVGIITGSGSHALAGLEGGERLAVATPYGECELTRGRLAGQEVVHVSRHGPGHARLSSSVNHRANVWALRELGARAVVGCTACGALDPDLELGSLVVFDDLHFLANRLPDGSLCTFFAEPGDPQRAHWVLHGGPFSPELRLCLARAAAALGGPWRDGGVYGHVDGPRFNTPVEISVLTAAGVAAVSQTGGPETVLCGELGLPYALLGYVTDHANEVRPGEPTPVQTLTALMADSRERFAGLLERAVGELAAASPRGAGTILRMG